MHWSEMLKAAVGQAGLDMSASDAKEYPAHLNKRQRAHDKTQISMALCSTQLVRINDYFH